MEELKRQIRSLETDVHEIQVNVAVLSQKITTLSASLDLLASSVAILNTTLTEHAALIKLARVMYVAFGAVVAASATYLAWIKAK